jgi:hypothetical protein
MKTEEPAEFEEEREPFECWPNSPFGNVAESRLRRLMTSDFISSGLFVPCIFFHSQQELQT